MLAALTFVFASGSILPDARVPAMFVLRGQIGRHQHTKALRFASLRRGCRRL